MQSVGGCDCWCGAGDALTPTAGRRAVHQNAAGCTSCHSRAARPLGMLVGIAPTWVAIKGQRPNVAPGGRQVGPGCNRTRFRGPTVCMQSEMQLWLLPPAAVHGEIQAEALPFVPPLGRRAQVGLVQPWSCGVPRPSVHPRSYRIVHESSRCPCLHPSAEGSEGRSPPQALRGRVLQSKLENSCREKMTSSKIYILYIIFSFREHKCPLSALQGYCREPWVLLWGGWEVSWSHCVHRQSPGQ